MSAKTDAFIATISVLARNEYLARDRWILPSICIAQAALESGWNLSASTLFGIKYTGSGESFTTSTSEYYNSHYVQIKAAFQKYPNVTAAVKGYYDFMTTIKHYAKAVNMTNYKAAITEIQRVDPKTGKKAYATSPDYVSKIVSIVEQYNLTQYDTRSTSMSKPTSTAAKTPTSTSTAKSTSGTTLVSEYTVVKGDTLSAIGAKLGVTWQTIAATNNIPSPYTIIPGQKLKISATTGGLTHASTYTVKDGDSLWAIAKSFLGSGQRYAEIKKLNGLISDSIHPGQVLKIPAK